jgi:hypothetical protein
MKKSIAIFLSLMLLSGSAVLAHPGHGTSDGFSLYHYLTSPLHVIFILLLVAGLVFIKYRRSVKQKR